MLAARKPEGLERVAQAIGDAGGQGATSLALDAAGAPLVGGYYSGTIDFGAGALPAGIGSRPFLT